MIGFILLYRDLLEWQWYQNPTVSRLFIHLLLKANYTEKKWQGHLIKRGQLITSISNLSSELSLSNQEIRTALRKLQDSGFITRHATNRFTVVTIINYGIRQSASKFINTQNAILATNKQQTNNKQITTTNEGKNNKKINKETIEVRHENFKKKVFEHSQYSNKILNDFFNYWTELNVEKTKMKFESRGGFFEIGKRLEKWNSNEWKIAGKNNNRQNTVSNR